MLIHETGTRRSDEPCGEETKLLRWWEGVHGFHAPSCRE